MYIGVGMRLKSNIVLSKIESESILINNETGDFYSLNETCTRIIELLIDNKKKEEIIEIIGTEYEVAIENIIVDISKCIDELQAMNIWT